MKRVAAVWMLLVGGALGAIPATPTLTVDLATNAPQWDLRVKQGNVMRIPMVLRQEGAAWDATGYTVEFVYGANRDATGMVFLAGTVSTSTVTFTTTSNFFGRTCEKWYSTLLISSGTVVYSRPEGWVTVERAGETGAGALDYQKTLWGDAFTRFVGTFTNWPFWRTNQTISATITNEADPVWLASGVSGRVVAVEGFTNRAATAVQPAGLAATSAADRAYTDVATGGVWTVAQYPGALLTDGSRVADYLIVGSKLFLDNYPGYGIVGTMESNGFSLVAGPGTNATLDFSQPAVIWHWQGALDLFASTNSNFDIAFYSGPDSLERMRVDYDGNVYVANTVTAAQFSGSAPWSILTNAPPGMAPSNSASVTWASVATSAQGVVTWQATANATNYVGINPTNRTLINDSSNVVASWGDAGGYWPTSTITAPYNALNAFCMRVHDLDAWDGSLLFSTADKKHSLTNWLDVLLGVPLLYATTETNAIHMLGYQLWQTGLGGYLLHDATGATIYDWSSGKLVGDGSGLTNLPAGTESDPVWQASGISNRVVTLEGYTGRVAAVEGYTNRAATAIQPGAGAYDLSLGTNPPAPWTNDTITIVGAGTNVTVQTNTAGNVRTYTVNSEGGGTAVLSAGANVTVTTNSAQNWTVAAAAGGAGGTNVWAWWGSGVQALGTLATPASGTQAVDIASGAYVTLAITSTPVNIALAAPPSTSYCGSVWFEVTHAPDTVARTCVWSTATCAFPGGTQPVLSQGSNNVDLLNFVWGPGGKFRLVNLVRALQ